MCVWPALLAPPRHRPYATGAGLMGWVVWDDIASGEVWPDVDVVELERAANVADAALGVAIARLRATAVALRDAGGAEQGAPTTGGGVG